MCCICLLLNYNLTYPQEWSVMLWNKNLRQNNWMRKAFFVFVTVHHSKNHNKTNDTGTVLVVSIRIQWWQMSHGRWCRLCVHTECRSNIQLNLLLAVKFQNVSVSEWRTTFPGIFLLQTIVFFTYKRWLFILSDQNFVWQVCFPFLFYQWVANAVCLIYLSIAG